MNLVFDFLASSLLFFDGGLNLFIHLHGDQRFFDSVVVNGILKSLSWRLREVLDGLLSFRRLWGLLFWRFATLFCLVRAAIIKANINNRY